MTPKRDLILIEVDKPKQQTDSGLYIQEDWKTLPPKGKVLKVGPEVTTIKEGDIVVFERYASVILRDEQRLCKESHVLATIEE